MEIVLARFKALQIPVLVIFFEVSALDSSWDIQRVDNNYETSFRTLLLSMALLLSLLSFLGLT